MYAAFFFFLSFLTEKCGTRRPDFGYSLVGSAGRWLRGVRSDFGTCSFAEHYHPIYSIFHIARGTCNCFCFFFFGRTSRRHVPHTGPTNFHPLQITRSLSTVVIYNLIILVSYIRYIYSLVTLNNIIY